MIELKEIYSGYAKCNVLCGVSLNVERGKIMSVIGPNGSGKSTLLKTMAGIIPFTSGSIIINGKEKNAMSRKEVAQNIAYLSQGKNVPDMTVGQMVLHGRFPYLDYPRRYSKEDNEMVQGTLARMGIKSLSDSKLSCLSGGMRQNAYIAMALAQDADYILLDEPTTYLDISNQLSLLKTLRSLAEEGKGIVTVMHDIPLALSFSDSVAVLCEGKVLRADTPDAVCDSKIINEMFGVSVSKRPDGNGFCYEF